LYYFFAAIPDAIYDVVSGAIYNTKYGARINIPGFPHFYARKGVQLVN